MTETHPVNKETNMQATLLDIRDIPMGATYWVVTKADGRCVNHPNFPMFRAAWLNQKEAKEAAKEFGTGHRAVKTIKD